MSRISTSSGPGELLVELRRDTGVPLHQQLESGIRTRIRAGLLRADTVMPSTRALAQDLGLSRGVVVEAYQQLVAEGYLVSRGGGRSSRSKQSGPRRTPGLRSAAVWSSFLSSLIGLLQH